MTRPVNKNMQLLMDRLIRAPGSTIPTADACAHSTMAPHRIFRWERGQARVKMSAGLILPVSNKRSRISDVPWAPYCAHRRDVRSSMPRSPAAVTWVRSRRARASRYCAGVIAPYTLPLPPAGYPSNAVRWGVARNAHQRQDRSASKSNFGSTTTRETTTGSQQQRRLRVQRRRL
jgi:hypothetical protein